MNNITLTRLTDGSRSVTYRGQTTILDPALPTVSQVEAIRAHGGARTGSGRKAGGKNKTPRKAPKPDKAVTCSISAPASVWKKIDGARGKSSRGKWLATDARLRQKKKTI